MKQLLLTFLASLLIGGLDAQTITVTYDANLGAGGLGSGAAAKVYWHSGGGTLGPWEYVIGNWGLDDGIGEMTETSDDIWEITVDAPAYYGAAGYPDGDPVNHIGMVFRNEDGTLEGKNYGGLDIFAIYDDVTGTYDVDCDCVTIGVEGVGGDVSPIADVTEEDADGVAISDGDAAIVQGIVHGVNLRSSGLEFTIIDATGGIVVFNFSETFGYTVNEGDEVRVEGVIDQFNGLTEIIPDTVIFLSADNDLMAPTPVLSLGETTESQLVSLANCTIDDPADWLGTGSSFNVDLTCDGEAVVMRIDDQVELSSAPIPAGAFNLTGLGGQFDNSFPYTGGYQIFPRYAADIELIVEDTSGVSTIASISAEDADGVALSLDSVVTIKGIVYGFNLRPTGLDFTVIDLTGGIKVFSSSADFGYVPNEGDEVQISGTIDQFNGLTEIIPDTVIFLSEDNVLKIPVPVSTLSEATESDLVQLTGCSIVDPADWIGGGASFNVELDCDGETITMRIDDLVDLSTAVAPEGSFTLRGLGGQFDFSSPYTEGYQIFPRYTADIILDPVATVADIADVTGEDADGVATSDGELVELTGIVYGGNLRPTGLDFTIIDLTGGIKVFSSSLDFGYTVTEGDEVRVTGVIDQFNGLTQIIPESVILLSTGNTLKVPTAVTALGESTESDLVSLEFCSLVDPAQWLGDGSSFNVDIVCEGSGTLVMRIDDLVDLSTALAPADTFHLTGIGGQFDNSSPYTEGYQIFPRYTADIELVPNDTTGNPNAIQNPEAGGIRLFPNPVSTQLVIQSRELLLGMVTVTDLSGRIVYRRELNTYSEQIDLTGLAAGTYYITLLAEEQFFGSTIVKL